MGAAALPPVITCSCSPPALLHAGPMPRLPAPPFPMRCSYEIYLYFQRGLFERHKLIFSLMLANKVLVSCTQGYSQPLAASSALAECAWGRKPLLQGAALCEQWPHILS